MLTLKTLRDDPQHVIDKLAVKNFDAKDIVYKVLELDDHRKALQTESDSLLAKQKQLAAQVGGLMKEGKKAEAEEVKKEVGELKAKSNDLLAQADANNKELQEQLVLLPNMPCDLVIPGKGAEDNQVVKMGGPEAHLPQDALPHWELAKKYDIIDFDLGVKLTGAGFPVYKGKGAKLQRALINYFLDFNTAAGYKEVEPPVMVNAASGFGTGQLPDKEAQMYYVGLDDFYMVPTAEVPVTNIFRDVILGNEDFPQKLTAYTPCFRREAGSYGKDVRGLNRLHQFDKVEIVRIEKPENSYAALDEMVAHVEKLVNSLGLKYRILRLCGGDLSFTSAITYDFELWSAAQKRWLEISSVSNFETYQANRLHLRYRDENGKMQLCHTLNGSSLALPRVVASLLEDYETETGVIIPEVLRPYTGFDKID
ncbi:MAG: serine--tRNA ligase [Bacteroidales bacterium]|jgi:seryl-tRNA synthetase|nr:serine--tRNA ligase [Bacteroidales bacterium]MEE3391364.1 serine--tRNA ligase [Candidatus Cryptobacteroides sp.]MCH3941902.1 serine--tRNA ligase [Bacteroidales bacterium]MCI2136216.1 serine--tRNA ligase [Bacteroidales bacterium]MCI5720489.1 serine--tRNA ligase [Bacteroidales bacterium]